MAKNVKKLVLPFAVSGKERFKPFTKDMEMASVFYMAEKDRKKGEGRVLKKPDETLLFIAETCYPLWLVPWRGKTLIFDGLEFTNQPVSYDVIPDIKAFDTDLLASSKSRPSYLAALSQNTNYFQKFVGQEEKTIEGLIADQDFMYDLMDYLHDAQDIGKVETVKAILTPMLDENEVTASVTKLSELRDLVDEDIKNLSKSMKLVSKASRDQVKSLEEEMRKNIKEFDTKIAKLKPKVMAKVKTIKEKRDQEVIRVSTKYDRKLRTLHQSRIKLELTLERLSGKIERIEADIKACRERKDEATELELSKKLDETKKQTPFLDKQIKDVDAEIANVEDAKKIDVAKARSKSSDLVDEAMQPLHDLEAEKEAQIRMDQQELDTLDDRTSSIIKQMDTMVKEKEATSTAIDRMGVEEKRRDPAIVYLPVYFVCYETDSGKRYVVFPPSLVGSMGIKTKLKSVFGSGKMKQFLHSRSQAITALLDRLVDLTQENPVFEKEIIEAGTKANILRTTALRLGVKKGLTELKDEKWLSDSEFDEFTQQLGIPTKQS